MSSKKERKKEKAILFITSDGFFFLNKFNYTTFGPQYRIELILIFRNACVISSLS